MACNDETCAVMAQTVEETCVDRIDRISESNREGGREGGRERGKVLHEYFAPSRHTSIVLGL